ncbi:MAG: DNA-processing protein DprA [Oceanobacter sp.]
MNIELLRAWWRLSKLPRVGNVALNRIRERLDTVDDLIGSTARNLEFMGLNDEVASRWASDASLDAGFDKLLAWLEPDRQGVMLAGLAPYPEQLASLNDAPTFLYWRGQAELSSLSDRSIAMVGSRNPSHAALEWTHEQAGKLAAAGLTVVSGMALGIDTAAHSGALRSAASQQIEPGCTATLAVLGCGVDVIYPKRNRELAEAILERGLLLSEFPPGTPAQAANFPSRNRIISGLTLGTVVVEAAVKSGSLITARMAASQGREVMAVPGALGNPLSRGCHSLIRDGAQLVEDAEQIIETLSFVSTFDRPRQMSSPAGSRGEKSPKRSATAQPSTGSQNELNYSSGPDQKPPQNQEQSNQPRKSTRAPESALWEFIDYSATSVDLLVMRSGLAVHEVLQQLMILELEGYVCQVPGGYRRSEG